MISSRRAAALLAGATSLLPKTDAGGVCINQSKAVNESNRQIRALEREKDDLLGELTKATCEPGNHYRTTKHGCVQCPENQFRTGDMGNCARCSNGMVSDAGASACRYDVNGNSEYMCGPNTVVANDPTGMLGNCRVGDPKKGEFSLGYHTNLEFSKCGGAGDGYDFAKMNSKESPCTPCGPGTYSKDGFCAPCGVNQYQDLSGQTECKACNLSGSLASTRGGAKTCDVSQRAQNAIKYDKGGWLESLANLAIGDESFDHMHPEQQNAIYDKKMKDELIKTDYHRRAFNASPQYRQDHLQSVSDQFEACRRSR